MDLNSIYALLIATIPLFLSLIFTKRYNIIHGLVTFLFTTCVTVVAVSLLSNHIPAEVYAYLSGEASYLPYHTALFSKSYTLYSKGMNLVGLSNVLDATYSQYVFLGLFAVVFLVSHIISVMVRKHRVNTIKALRRQVKRY